MKGGDSVTNSVTDKMELRLSTMSNEREKMRELRSNFEQNHSEFKADFVFENDLDRLLLNYRCKAQHLPVLTVGFSVLTAKKEDLITMERVDADQTSPKIAEFKAETAAYVLARHLEEKTTLGRSVMEQRITKIKADALQVRSLRRYREHYICASFHSLSWIPFVVSNNGGSKAVSTRDLCATQGQVCAGQSRVARGTNKPPENTGRG
jgi:hypothetical protein